nr:unnamed protein product [Callosobruchus chinensis]
MLNYTTRHCKPRRI